MTVSSLKHITLWTITYTRDPEFGKSNKLAAIFTSLVDPVDGFFDGKVKIEPTRLSVDGGSLVLLDQVRVDHSCEWTETWDDGSR